jgi:hypothetical protein
MYILIILSTTKYEQNGISCHKETKLMLKISGFYMYSRLKVFNMVTMWPIKWLAFCLSVIPLILVCTAGCSVNKYCEIFP